MLLEQFNARFTPLIRDTMTGQLAGVEVPELRQAMAHLLGRGKLFRPLLALACQYSCGGINTERCVRLVSPLEMIHTFTLIHDDLPCMDNAQLRRGVAAVHVAHGEAMGVLAGDALLNIALQLLAAEALELDCRLRLRLLESATRATAAVVEGQVLDMLGEGRELELPELERMDIRKTGALIGACCETGALLAGAEDKLVEALRAAGERMGLAFQIRDDLLSASGSEEDCGKTLSTDEEKNKSTYVRALGVSGAEAYLRSVLSDVEMQIRGLGLADPGLLLAIAQRAAQRDR